MQLVCVLPPRRVLCVAEYHVTQRPLFSGAVMPISDEPRALSSADASSRLLYIADVRQNTRHASAGRPWARVGVGGLVIARGLQMRYLPHLPTLSIIWLVPLIGLRVSTSRWLARRRQLRGGIMQATRYEHAPLLGAGLVALLVLATDAHLMITALVAGLTVSAWLTGLVAVAACTAAAGLVTAVLLLHGTPTWAALLVAGAGLVAAGALPRQQRASQ